jgi:hypothetical protein
VERTFSRPETIQRYFKKCAFQMLDFFIIKEEVIFIVHRVLCINLAFLFC